MKNFDNKQNILNAAWELLEESQDPNSITVRIELLGGKISTLSYMLS